MDHVEKELRADNEAEHDDEEVDPRIQVTIGTRSMHRLIDLQGSKRQRAQFTVMVISTNVG